MQNLWKSYDELRKNRTEILRSFENRAQGQHLDEAEVRYVTTYSQWLNKLL